MPASIERSTYLLFVAAMTAILALFWAPVGGTLWLVEGIYGAVLLGVFVLGWVIVLVSTFLINHFHLFGLQQAWTRIDESQSKEATFVTPLFYRLVRHPMMTGVLISLWAAPHLTVDRLVLNVAFTAYVLIGVHFEEKTLVKDLGEDYLDYRKTTPSLVPGLKLGR